MTNIANQLKRPGWENRGETGFLWKTNEKATEHVTRHTAQFENTDYMYPILQDKYKYIHSSGDFLKTVAL